MSLDPKLFRQVMGRFLTGVTVVSVEDEEGVHGMTASSFLSVSLNPPLVLVSVDHRAHTLARIQKAGRYAVSFLAEGQEGLSNHFAGRPQAGLDVAWQRGESQTPVLAGALGWVDCTLVDAHVAGDHTLFIGQVEALAAGDGQPLAYFSGRYRALREDGTAQ